MTTSMNQKIQQLIDEVERLNPGDSNLEAKLTVIAEKVAAEQHNMKMKPGNTAMNDNDIIDPAEAFACEGCQ